MSRNSIANDIKLLLQKVEQLSGLPGELAAVHHDVVSLRAELLGTRNDLNATRRALSEMKAELAAARAEIASLKHGQATGVPAPVVVKERFLYFSSESNKYCIGHEHSASGWCAHT